MQPEKKIERLPSTTIHARNLYSKGARMQITQARVKELFDYREDGELILKARTAYNTRKGDAAGCSSCGYRRTSVDYRRHMNHRLIWLWHYGYLPENRIDHINRNKSDNRIENLREVSHACNLRNTGNHCTNTSGVKGVRWHKGNKKWAAHITVNGKEIFLGIQPCFLEAACLRLAAEQAVGWEGCDSCSPAFQYVKKHIQGGA